MVVPLQNGSGVRTVELLMDVPFRRVYQGDFAAADEHGDDGSVLLAM